MNRRCTEDRTRLSSRRYVNFLLLAQSKLGSKSFKDLFKSHGILFQNALSQVARQLTDQVLRLFQRSAGHFSDLLDDEQFLTVLKADQSYSHLHWRLYHWCWLPLSIFSSDSWRDHPMHTAD